MPEFQERCSNNLSEVIVTEQDVVDMISVLNANKATGPDTISNKMLISVKREISKALCLLFNKSLRERMFPSEWKTLMLFPCLKTVTSLYRLIIGPFHYSPVLVNY